MTVYPNDPQMNKAEAEILKRIDLILCFETSVNTIQLIMFLT